LSKIEKFDKVLFYKKYKLLHTLKYCIISFNLDRGVTCDPSVRIFSFGHLPKLV
jgi:hypothetical protein